MSLEEQQLKKPAFKIKAPLKEHLKHYSRYADLPLSYDDLTSYRDLIPTSDDGAKATLWYLVMYHSYDMDRIHDQLIKIYELLVADGDEIPFLRKS